jgi:uncharacterized membrane protein YphA (DoxX/SURF4 family)
MTARPAAADYAALLLRCVLGGYFIWMGAHKALDPVDFLKLVRQYDLVQAPLLLNLIAAGLPWFEIICGALLILGLAPRGAALLIFAMLVPFTLAILRRAVMLQESTGTAFCLIKFDCGCGAGEVFVCRKLAENTLWTLVSAWLALRSRHLLTWWPRPAPAPELEPGKPAAS